MKPMEATVWGWGDDFDDVRKNSEKYVSKRWRGLVKECSIEIMARERNEGIRYHIIAFTSKPEDVGKLSEKLFFISLSEGDTKVNFVTIQLFDTKISEKIWYRGSMEGIEKELSEREKIISNRFINDPKISTVAQGRKVIFIQKIDLLCELESKMTNKIIVEAIFEDFSKVKEFVNSLSKKIIKEGLAERILGYKLGRSI
ncbi:MAG: hypothetical protein ACPLRT_09125, partial [Thermoproteota archaeon]